jgi:hypothetical protein
MYGKYITKIYYEKYIIRISEKPMKNTKANEKRITKWGGRYAKE